MRKLCKVVNTVFCVRLLFIVAFLYAVADIIRGRRVFSWVLYTY